MKTLQEQFNLINEGKILHRIALSEIINIF